MTFKLFAFFFLVYPIQLWAQEKSNSIVNIPGTHIFMEKPPSFHLGDNFIGLERDDYTGIQILELDGGDFYANTRNLNRAEYESRGVTVIEMKDSIIDGYPAIISAVQGVDITSLSIQMVFGDSTFSVCLLGTVPAGDEEVQDLMRKIMLSARYDKNFVVDPKASAVFTFDDTQSQFKLAKSTSNLYFFTLDGIAKDSYLDGPLITVSSMPSNTSVSPKSISLGTIKGIREDMVELFIEEDSFSKINDFRAYEVVYRGISTKGDEVKVYSFTIMNETHIVTAFAIAHSDFDNTIDECKKLTRTVRIK